MGHRVASDVVVGDLGAVLQQSPLLRRRGRGGWGRTGRGFRQLRVRMIRAQRNFYVQLFIKIKMCVLGCIRKRVRW